MLLRKMEFHRWGIREIVSLMRWVTIRGKPEPRQKAFTDSLCAGYFISLSAIEFDVATAGDLSSRRWIFGSLNSTLVMFTGAYLQVAQNE